MDSKPLKKEPESSSQPDSLTLDDIIETSKDLCNGLMNMKFAGYERVINAVAELIVATELSRLEMDSVSGGMAHDLATSRAYKILRKSGMPAKEAEIRSGFGSAEDNLRVRDLAPGEDVELPVVRVVSKVSEQEEAKAYYLLMDWLSTGPRPFWQSRMDGMTVRIEPRPSDPTVIQVGWYDDAGVLISHIDFEVRFQRHKYSL